jgi:hypothetical protein
MPKDQNPQQGPQPDLEAEVILLGVRLEATRRDTRLAFARMGVRFPPEPGPGSMPPGEMRPEAQSSHDWKAFTEKAVEAVRVGVASPGTTPEEQIRKVVAEEEAKRVEAKEVARLRREEDERIAALLAAKAQRRKAIWHVAVAVAGGVSTFSALEVVKYLATLHH